MFNPFSMFTGHGGFIHSMLYSALHYAPFMIVGSYIADVLGIFKIMKKGIGKILKKPAWI